MTVRLMDEKAAIDKAMKGAIWHSKTAVAGNQPILTYSEAEKMLTKALKTQREEIVKEYLRCGATCACCDMIEALLTSSESK